MAEFHFYGTQEDWWLYLNALSQVGQYTFIVDDGYNTPVPVQFRNIDADAKRVLTNRSKVYLWSDQYSRFSPSFELPKDLWWIVPIRSGPALDLSLPACYLQNGVWRLNFGNLSYEREYCNPQTEDWYKPPAALKKDFITVRKLLQRLMVKRYARMEQQVFEKRPEIKTLWIGLDAIKKLEAGEAQIKIYTDWWKGSELSKTRK